jgi:fibronectin-binding autotransporter adhesin
VAILRVKTWSAGEVLTASDLNAEFNNILNNPVALWSPAGAAVDFDGQTLTLDAAAATTVASSSSLSWNFTSGAKAGTPATTGSVANWSAQTFTDSATSGSGTAASFVAHGIQRPTLAATNASVTTTNAATFYIANAPAAGTNETLTNSYALWIDDGRVRLDPSATVVSAAGATLDAVNVTAQTATITGSTNITTATGVNFVSIGTPTLSAGAALTVTNAASLYIAAAPAGAGAGPATITNAYAIWVDAGNVRFDGDARVDGDINWLSGTAFAATLAHNNAAARTYTFQDHDMTVGDAITSGTQVATTSGTAHTFTGIPSWVKRVTFQVIGVSTGGSNSLIIQIGPSGGLENSGYSGTISAIGGGDTTGNIASAFHVSNGSSAGATYHGHGVLTLENAATNTWTFMGMFGRSDSGQIHVCGGTKSLAGALERIGISAAGDTFDAGAVNILYE